MRPIVTRSRKQQFGESKGRTPAHRAHTRRDCVWSHCRHSQCKHITYDHHAYHGTGLTKEEGLRRLSIIYFSSCVNVNSTHIVKYYRDMKDVL